MSFTGKQIKASPLCENRGVPAKVFAGATKSMSANPTAPGTLPRPEDLAPGEHYWSKASKDLRHRLNKAMPHDLLKELHHKSPARHFLVAGRQFGMLIAASAVA